MNTIHTKRPSALARLFERFNIAVSLHYTERDLAYERHQAEMLPRKVKALERQAELLRVRQAVLRGE